ncbi:unnamed protein product [Oppiella nova]|uniref:Uncharacterized protein n=1 Tax=Oppiella nova TaxID=334625 RepID=A0A7R9MD01_9ACAR|nr:unnamed protein product [Oppiella nova]CAG2174078.1 unnamed protein product [Oppiella nova]
MDCVFDGPDRGFYIKSARGRGGPVQDIQVKNIKMTNIKKEFIMMDMTYPDNYPKEIKAETFKKTTPVYKDITIDGITGDAKNSISITGLPESHIENVKFMNIEYTSHHDDGGFLQNFTDSITKSNFTYHYKKAMLV